MIQRCPWPNKLELHKKENTHYLEGKAQQKARFDAFSILSEDDTVLDYMTAGENWKLSKTLKRETE